MVFIGFAWFATFLADAGSSLVFTLGTAVESIYLLGFVYLVLSFPTGRLRSTLDRTLIAAAIAIVTVVELAWLLFADSHSQICSQCPHNAFEIARNGSVANGILQGQRSVGVALSLFTVALLVRRWRRATAPERRAGAPVLWAGSAMFAALAFSVGNDIFDHPLGQGPAWTREIVFASIPIAVLAALLQRQLARGAVAGLVVELGEGATSVDLREALGRALGDPSLELAYWVPASAATSTSTARRSQLPRPGGERAATVVERDGEPIAALIHDPALRENAGARRSVCAAAALDARERAAAGRAARAAGRAAGLACAPGRGDGDGAAADRARPARRHAAAARLDRDDARPGRVEARGRPTAQSEPVLREARRGADGRARGAARAERRGSGRRSWSSAGSAAALDDLAQRAALPVRARHRARAADCRSRSRRPPTSSSARRWQTRPSTRTPARCGSPLRRQGWPARGRGCRRRDRRRGSRRRLGACAASPTASRPSAAG